MANDKALTGELIGAGKKLAGKGGTLPAVAGLDALNELVGCVTVIAQEKTKQARLTTYRDTEVSRIKAAESILHKYFDGVFADRRANIDGLFKRLDQALDSGDSQAITQVVNAVVDIAKTSPLADLGDLSQIRAALDDPDQIWEL